jgi:4-amino-4-deoxy-L-arabinose transferase-like glycosyltransferase
LRIRPGWRLQLALVLFAAAALRSVFFVGFGLGDDLGYIAHADEILAGRYPPLDPLNQYAYRPLLLYLFAGGIAAFGHTDFGVVAPVFLSAIVATALVFLFVRRLVDPAAAWWCALLYACQPFNVVNSTTMTNDVILACLTFASLTMFLVADRGGRVALFAGAGVLMVAAFLVKITCLPVVVAIGFYSLISLRARPADVLRRHSVFYATLLTGILCVCLVYYFKKGDLLWQFKAEAFYYETYQPDWYKAGAIDYAALMWQYPRSLFGLSGPPGFTYLHHGFLFWLVVPAAVAVLMRRGYVPLKVLVALIVIVFAFFEFYPQYLSPRYLPLVRQERYLEMLLPAAVIVGGTALYWLYRRQPIAAVAILGVLLADFVVEAGRRYTEYDDSQEDLRALARYAGTTIAATGAGLALDRPAANALKFYLRSPLRVTEVGPNQHMGLRRTYVAVGGARSFWWSRDEVLDVEAGVRPPHWILTYEVPGRPFPWRPSNLRVYYIGDAPMEWEALFDAPRAVTPAASPPGLTESAYPDGFDAKPVVLGTEKQIPDIDNALPVTASRLEWTGWLRADDAVYTFESRSDDGSWIELNGKLLLDNGGTHPAKVARRTVRLARGWYAFRLRYEDTGGDRFLRVRVYKDHGPDPVPQTALFFSR